MTVGAGQLSNSEHLFIQLAQIFGCGCFAISFVQDAATKLGATRKLESWSSRGSVIANTDNSPAAKVLAAVGIITSIILAVGCLTSQAFEMCRIISYPAGGYGSIKGVALLTVSVLCWTSRARFAKPIPDLLAWIMLGGPILADLLVDRVAALDDPWSTVLCIWIVATIFSSLISFTPRFSGVRATSIALVASGLLMSAGFLSASFDASRNHVWLIAWFVGTLAALAVTAHQGNHRGIRILAGMPVISGMILSFVAFDEVRTLWTQLFLSGNRITPPVVAICWFLFCGVIWRSRFIMLKRVSGQEPSRFRVDSALLWLGALFAALMSIEIATGFTQNGIAEFQRFGLPLVLLLGLMLAAVILSVVRWDRSGQMSVGVHPVRKSYQLWDRNPCNPLDSWKR